MTYKSVTPCTEAVHTFHIPVMGTAFSVESPVKVARYGISSVVSLVDDLLLEQMREHHCRARGLPFEAIPADSEDSRARRITAYLNLLDMIVAAQSAALQKSAFEEGSEISRYYELLPQGPLKSTYLHMQGLPPGDERTALESELRRRACPGSIDVNIMTKLDHLPLRNGVPLPPEQSDAMAALRGYARSRLRSAIVFSAGMHPRLYGYAANFEDFFPREEGAPVKRIILKVSDYRSAEIQGRFLAKRGLWVSEFRVESALNCGGHTFPSSGLLMGPILEEFRANREKLVEKLHTACSKALAGAGRPVPADPLPLRITVQGGIGTAAEDLFLRSNYGVDGTGWGTPFMLVPEATTVDEVHLGKLANAAEGDVYLSRSSPMGLPFWNLRTSASEESRRRRIAEGRPGSPCPKGHLRFNTEYSETPLCLASRAFQRRRLAAIKTEDLLEEQRAAAEEDTLCKSCICHDLAGAATLAHGIDPDATPAVCSGPGVRHFTGTSGLDEMTGHIYGRVNLLKDSGRPHMFLKEFELYISYLAEELERFGLGLSGFQQKQLAEMRANLSAGADYYRRLAAKIAGDGVDGFRSLLESLAAKLDSLPVPA